MKKQLLLTLTMLLVVGNVFTQDIYVGGMKENSKAIVTKNGTSLYTYGDPFNNADFFYTSSIDYEANHDDLYWAVNNDYNYSPYEAFVFKNDELYLDTPLSSAISKTCFIDGYGLRSFGSCLDEENFRTACIWIEDDPDPHFFYSEFWESEFLDATVVNFLEGVGLTLFCCGYGTDSEGNMRSCFVIINEEGEQCFPIPMDYDVIDSSCATEVAFYDGMLYISGYYILYGESKAFVYVYNLNDVVLDFYNVEGSSRFSNLYVDCDIVYTSGYDGSGHALWKNGDLIFNTEGPIKALSGYSNGILFVSDSPAGANVWENGRMIYRIEEISEAFALLVVPQCDSEEAFTLPFYESFDMGSTHWDCWTYDHFELEILGSISPYWHRTVDEFDADEYYVIHGYHPTEFISNYLDSPLLYIDSNADDVVLSFDSQMPEFGYISDPLVVKVVLEDGTRETVWSTDANAYDYAQMNRMTVDLTKYVGHTIRIEFCYEGTDSCFWIIDNVAVEGTIAATYTITVSVNDPTMGTVTGGNVYKEGDIAELTAYPAEGFVFKSWNDGVTENPRYVEVTGDLSFIALFQREGIDEQGAKHLSLTPNPANDKIWFDGLTEASIVNIYNSTGMIVKSVSVEGKTEIDVSDLAPGMYFVKTNQHTAKFVISK